MADESCHNCRFYLPDARRGADAPNVAGRCRRRAPIPNNSSQAIGMVDLRRSQWPKVLMSDWCGEWTKS